MKDEMNTKPIKDKEVIYNWIMCDNGVRLPSFSSHDYKQGLGAPVERSGSYTEMSVYSDDHFEVIRRFFCTKGSTSKWIPLYAMDNGIITYNKVSDREYPYLSKCDVTTDNSPEMYNKKYDRVFTVTFDDENLATKKTFTIAEKMGYSDIKSVLSKYPYKGCTHDITLKEFFKEKDEPVKHIINGIYQSKSNNDLSNSFVRGYCVYDAYTQIWDFEVFDAIVQGLTIDEIIELAKILHKAYL